MSFNHMYICSVTVTFYAQMLHSQLNHVYKALYILISLKNNFAYTENISMLKLKREREREM